MTKQKVLVRMKVGVKENPRKRDKIVDRGEIINDILVALNSKAILEHRAFDYGNTFISLAFMGDENLYRIARACGIRKKPRKNPPSPDGVSVHL